MAVENGDARTGHGDAKRFVVDEAGAVGVHATQNFAGFSGDFGFFVGDVGDDVVEDVDACVWLAV